MKDIVNLSLTDMESVTDSPGFWKSTQAYIWLPIGIAVFLILCLITIWMICKCRRRYLERHYDYSALEDEMGLSEKLRLERQMQIDARRESALLNFQFYLRSMTGKYSMQQHLPDIGSRLNRNWFIVNDIKVKKNRLMTMTIKPASCDINLNKSNGKTLKEMLQLIQHPYLLPVDNIDFIPEQDLVVVVQYYSTKGSLKDYIYKSKPKDLFEEKYSVPGRGLPLHQIQLYGKQVLEALIYLDNHGININGHVHAGNVIMHDDTCRLCGYENSLLGYPARQFHSIKRRLTRGKDEADALAFGMLLYEMCAGCELDTCSPNDGHLQRCQHSPEVLELLEFIFYNGKGKTPTLYQIKSHDFFSDVRLIAIEKHRPLPMQLTSSMKTLIKQSHTKRKGIKLKKTQEGRRRASSNPDQSSITPPHAMDFTKSLPPPHVGSPKSVPHPKVVHVQTPPAPTERTSLLRAIEKGTSLKKTVTADKSVPRV